MLRMKLLFTIWSTLRNHQKVEFFVVEDYNVPIRMDKFKVVVQKALDEAQLLFDSLMQEYFG